MERRFFLSLMATSGASLVVGCTELPPVETPPHPTATSTDVPPPAPKVPFSPDAWITVAPDGYVTVVIDKAEMGQGVETALCMLVAEDLDVPLNRVRASFAPADPAKYKNKIFGSQGTGGSTTIRGDYWPMRKAGAAARAMLMGAAAERWKEPVSSLTTENGEVVHAASKRRLAYGDLTADAAKVPVPADPPLREEKDFRVLGTRPIRMDARAKGMGKAKFGLDVSVDGMLSAVVVRCPVFGGTLKSFDGAKAAAVKDVKKVFRVSSGVCVVANHFWAAKQGAAAVTVAWDEGALAKTSSASLLKEAQDLLKKPGAAGEAHGDFEAAWKKAKKKLDVVFEVPFQAHAPMEPLNCTAHVRPDACEIWVPTQSPERVLKEAVRITGLDPSKIQVHSTYLGGGFGRRFEIDFVTEALEAAKEMGAPVKLVWTREDDIRHDFYRPASVTRARAILGEKGELEGLSYRVVSASINARTFPGSVKGVDRSAVEGLASQYSVPSTSVDYHPQNGIPVGYWRSVGHSNNAFVEECLIDELAAMAKIDPLVFRRALVKDNPRLAGVLERVAKEAEWEKPVKKGMARGIACHASFGSFAAQVAEVTVDKGKVRVHRVVAALDCGPIVHPGILESQVQGAIVYGLSAALKSSIEIEAGRVKQANFHDFKLLPIDEMPVVEVHIVKSNDKVGGAGEPGLPPIAPAVANAIFAATGKRIRKLPIRPADLGT